MKRRVRIVQQILQEKGFYNGAIDGIAGPVTMHGLAQIEGIDSRLPKTRQVTTFIQMEANERGINAGPVDGLWGPQTNAAFDELTYLVENGVRQPHWRPDEMTVPNPNGWPVQYSPAFYEFYGDRDSQLTMLNFPYEMRLSWDLRQKCRRTQCHERVADSLGRVLQNVKEIYGEENIKKLHLDHFSGCFNKRLMRNGTSWSMHSWGIALDFDHKRNALRWGRERAAFAHPDYYDWWKCWEEEGWISLGRKRNFDWMHVQAARLPE